MLSIRGRRHICDCFATGLDQHHLLSVYLQYDKYRVSVCLTWSSAVSLKRDLSLKSRGDPLLIFLNAFFFSSSSESPAPKLTVCDSSRGARPVDVTGGCTGETEDGRHRPGCRDAFDRQPDVYLSRRTLRRLFSSELEGGRAAEDPELQKLLRVLPHGCQELP